MTTPLLVNLSSLLDEAKCFALIRQHRWPEGVRCPYGDDATVARDGHGDTQRHRQRYRCPARGSRLDDLSGTVLAGHHQPLRVWILCLSSMGLTLSNHQITQETGLGRDGAAQLSGGARHRDARSRGLSTVRLSVGRGDSQRAQGGLARGAKSRFTAFAGGGAISTALLLGLLVHVLSGGRPESVPAVIEGCALESGRFPWRGRSEKLPSSPAKKRDA